MKKWLALTFLAFLCAFLGAYPNGANATFIRNTTMGNATADNATALGGLLSNVDLDGLSQTQLWQGFYGNISGTIVLADAAYYQMFNWTVVNVSGHVFAINSSSAPNSVGWINLIPGNTTVCDDSSHLNVSSDKTDSCNNTYTGTGSVTVAGRTISSAPQVYTFADNASAGSPWRQLLLSDNGSYDLITVGVLQNDANVYNSTASDFQIIVPENEYNQEGPSLYWFFLDLQ